MMTSIQSNNGSISSTPDIQTPAQEGSSTISTVSKQILNIIRGDLGDLQWYKTYLGSNLGGLSAVICIANKEMNPKEFAVQLIVKQESIEIFYSCFGHASITINMIKKIFKVNRCFCGGGKFIRVAVPCYKSLADAVHDELMWVQKAEKK
jgi:hypothetical protein